MSERVVTVGIAHCDCHGGALFAFRDSWSVQVTGWKPFSLKIPLIPKFHMDGRKRKFAKQKYIFRGPDGPENTRPTFQIAIYFEEEITMNFESLIIEPTF